MRQKRITIALAALALTLAACPAPENNDANGGGNANADTMDMGVDPEPDAGGEDAGEEPTRSARCVPEYALGGSVAAADGPSDQTWVVVCDHKIAAGPPTTPGERLSDRLRARLERADGSGEQTVGVGDVSCQPGEGEELDGLFVCEVTLEGITEDAPADGGPLGPVAYTVSAIGEDVGSGDDGLEVTWEGEWIRRYRVSRQTFSSAQLPRDLIGLPAGFAERGEHARVMQTESGRVTFGVTRAADSDALEVFSVAPDGQITTHKEVAPPPQGFAATGFEIAETPAGPNALWWGFDAREGQLRGVSVALGADGSTRSVDELDPTTYTGQPLTEVLDVSYGVNEVGGQTRLTARVLGVTGRNTFVTVRLGDAEGAARVTLERELDVLGGLQPSALGPGHVGLLSTDDIEAMDLDADAGSAWIADDNGKFSIIALDASREPTSLVFPDVQSPYEIDLSPSVGGYVFFTITGPPTGPFSGGIDISDFETLDGGKGTTFEVALLETPSGGIDPSGSWFIEDDVVIHLGRWPWNWRDKFKKSGFTDVPVITQWDLKQGGPDKAAPVTSVRPAIVEEPSAAGGAGDGDRVFTSITPDGHLELQKLDALTAGCSDPKACALPLTDFTRRGYRLNALPGEDGITWAVDKYGDILIDGVPLVFDLTAPPIIFDAPGADDQGAVILASIAHESATHAVWTTDTQGKLSEAGLLNVIGGEPEESVVFAEGDDGDDGDCDEGIIGLELTLGTVLIDFSKDSDEGDDGSQGRAAPVTLTVDELTKAIGSAEPVALDLSGRLPGPDKRVDEVFTLDPACSAPAESSLREAPEGEKVLAELTPEQAARPLVVTREGDTLTVHAYGAEGQLVELATIDGAGAGVAGGSGSSLVAADFNGRIKRIKIRKKRVGSNFRVVGANSDREGDTDDTGTEGETTIVIVEASTAVGEYVGSGDDGLEVTWSVDANGDGLDDLAVTPAGQPTQVLFGDGAGGFEPEPVEVPGGVTVYWPPPVLRATSGNGSGTRTATASIQIMNHLELL